METFRRGMVKFADQKIDLIDDGFLSRQRRAEQPFYGFLRKVYVHSNFLGLAGHGGAPEFPLKESPNISAVREGVAKP
jgi:hypothetical protein